MAWIFELAAECGHREESALEFGRYFDALTIRVRSEQAELLSVCNIKTWQDKESNWWCSVFPSGISKTGRNDNILKSKEQQICVVESLYDRLKTAPAFRYALIGFEIAPIDTFQELTDAVTKCGNGYHGLVLSRKLWERLGGPTEYVRLTVNLYWIPYRDGDYI